MKRLKSEKFLTAGAYIYTVISLLIILMPLLWSISSSFKQVKDIYKIPPSFIPPIPNKIALYINYDKISEEKTPEELLDIIKKDCMMMVYGVKKDFNTNENDNEIFRYDFYGLNGDKVIFYFNATQSKLFFSEGYMLTHAYQAHNIEKYYKVLMEKMGYKFDNNGLEYKTDLMSQSPVIFQGNIEIWINNPDSFYVTGDYKGYFMEKYILGFADNYINGWNSMKDSKNKYGFGLYFFNSILITFSSILGQILVSALAGYALSRLIKGKTTKILLMFFLATMMLPWFTTLIPNYLLVKSLGWLGTYLPMIIPGFASAFLIYIFKGFFDTLPGDLFACARIDGANELVIFSRICIPLSKAVIGVAVLMIFFGVWNEFMWSNIVTMGKDKIAPFPVMLYRTGGVSTILPGARIALAIIAAIPTLLIFGIFNKYIEKGIVWSGIKG